MGILQDITTRIFWIVFGAAVSPLVPAALVWWKYRRRPDLLGEWKSTYQGIDESAGTWVSEDITLNLSMAKFKFRNAESSRGYSYTASGSVKQKVFFVGDWESERPGANAYGAFVLTISAQGDCMYGYWVGPDKSGARRYGRWILARDVTGIENARRLMESMCLPSDVPSNGAAGLQVADASRLVKTIEAMLASSVPKDA